MDKTWYTILLVIIILVLGTGGNSAVLMVLITTRTLKTINNEFILHFSLVNFIGSSILSFFLLLGLHSTSQPTCLAEQVISVLCHSTTSLLILTFTLFRCLSIVHPLMVLVHVRLKTLRISLILPWCGAALCTMFSSLGATECVRHSWRSLTGTALQALLAVTIAVPAIVLPVCFTAMCVRVRRDAISEKKRRIYKERITMQALAGDRTMGTVEESFYQSESDRSVKPGDRGELRLGETAGTVTCDEAGHIKVGDNGAVDMETGDFVIQNPTFRESPPNVPPAVRKWQDKDVQSSSDGNSVFEYNDETFEKYKNANETGSVHSDNTSTGTFSNGFVNAKQTEQHSSHNFFQDMMLELHKSMRQSRHNLTLSLGSLSNHSATSVANEVSQNTDSNKLEEVEMCSALKRKPIVKQMSEETDRTDKTFEVVSLPGTPTFSPPPPPGKDMDEMSIDSECRAPSLPPPVPPRSTSELSIEQSYSEGDVESLKEDGRRTRRENPKEPPTIAMDRWLLQRMLSVDTVSIGTTTAPSTRQPSVKQLPELEIRLTQQDSIKRHSEGYSSSFMLIIIVLLFIVLQVPFAGISLHSLSAPSITSVEDDDILVREALYILLIIYYTVSPYAVIIICEPVKTVLLNRLVQFRVLLHDMFKVCFVSIKKSREQRTARNTPGTENAENGVQ